MADCLISPVLEIGKSIKSHFGYWWCFDNNIQRLSHEVRESDRQIYDLEHKIEGARLRLQVVRPGVEEWLEASTQKLEEARRMLLPDDNIPKACNLISRYALGKNAKQTAEEIAKLRNEGNFNIIADPVPPAAMAFPFHRLTLEFESRKSIEKDIIDSLRNDSVDVIGICGMGGIGKTTMAQRIGKRVKEENVFDEVVMVTVSQTMDMLKIQNEIADLLNLYFDKSSMAARACLLHRRLMDEKRKIIIFDDVWESLSFEELGIPIECNFERCKVLLTSRYVDACKGIKNKKVFKLKILEEDEAWLLFKDKAGDWVEGSRVATEVAAKCKGLPIALVTVGLALRDVTSIHTGENSLLQLRRGDPEDFPEVWRYVYNTLKLSYDYLDSDRNQDQEEKDVWLMIVSDQDGSTTSRTCGGEPVVLNLVAPAAVLGVVVWQKWRHVMAWKEEIK